MAGRNPPALKAIIAVNATEDIVPGEVLPLDIEMPFTSWVFPKGHHKFRRWKVRYPNSRTF